MMLLLSLVVGALGQSPAPTVPTPFPTVTPAPESQCLYMDTDNGPFALDCLQDAFITIGCSIRGDSYPTETREDTEDDDPEADKAWYNANTWALVKDQLQAVKDADGNDCNGDTSDQPSPSPTAEPTTKQPTPAPSKPPTSITPSPTYPAEYELTSLYSNDGSSPGSAAETLEAAKQACEDAGYARQYDMSQYVIALTIDGNTDYFTVVPTAQDSGFPVSICDMIGDPENVDTLWSDKIDGPFIKVDVTQDTPTMFDNRVYPAWFNRADENVGGGYAGLSGAAEGAQAYEIEITSMRTNSMCRERVAPQTETTGASPVFDDDNTYCTRAGLSLQDWGNTAEVCNDEDATALHYALANRMYSTCDDFCVYSPDYADDKANNQFWFWVAGSNCWKPRSQYVGGAFQECDTEHNDFTEERQTAYDHVVERAAMLCSERCDYVSGFTYAQDSCYIAISQSDYGGASGDVQSAKAQTYCDSTYGGNLASIANKMEGSSAAAVCDAVCYIGNNPATKGTAGGDWLDGSIISYVNFWGGSEGKSSEDGDYLTLQDDATWKYTDGDENFVALCEVDANTDASASNEDAARACVVDQQDNGETKVPQLNIADSGFTNNVSPGDLHFIVEVPQTMYNTRIAFEDATNDAGEYHWSYGNDYWNLKTAATDCTEDNVYEGAIPWTVFNLGGAGGVKRMATWTDENGVIQTTDDEENDDGSNAKYIFGSVMRIETTVPVQTSIDTDIDDEVHALRVAKFDRAITVRVPFVLQFQKTVTVTTEVDIISTKFNYKTVAAIIQSIQYETQYFQPPYAKVMLQIRTKSQYPYLFNKDVGTILLYPIDGEGNTNTNVDMSIEWLQDDSNCTFTNPDHMREGDVCTQEWMLYLTPNDNVCYATGEYTIEYTAGCFYGKDVCYLPFDNNGDEINTVSFTFKIQTSKFCPNIADEVDLAGTLTVTGRESFKPDVEGVEGNTDGSMYFQGETIHFFATTSSEKAKITSTKVIMVELEQDLSELVQTGFNRVPYDPTSNDVTVWTEAGPGRVADGTVTIDDGEDSTDVQLMQDSDVYPSGEDFGDYSFSATEAGFKILVHARAFPVNVDSFGQKKVLATLEVEYEALSGLRRRRLLATQPNADLRAETNMRLNAFRGQSMPKTLGESASMSLYMTLQANVNRGNVKAFTDSFRDAVVTALNDDAQSSKTVYEAQVAVDAVWTDGSRIWSRPRDHRFGSRRLLDFTPTQRLRVDFTFAKVNYANAMSLDAMVKNFYKQLKQPASQLISQNIFLGSVVHKCVEAPKSDYRPNTAFNGPPPGADVELVSAAPIAIPFALFSLIAAFLW